MEEPTEKTAGHPTGTSGAPGLRLFPSPSPHRAVPALCPQAICPNQPPALGGGQDAALAQRPLHVPKAFLASERLRNEHWPETPGADTRAHDVHFPKAHVGGTAGHSQNTTSSVPNRRRAHCHGSTLGAGSPGASDQGRPRHPARGCAHSLFLSAQRGELSAPSRQGDSRTAHGGPPGGGQGACASSRCVSPFPWTWSVTAARGQAPGAGLAAPHLLWTLLP